MAPLSQQVVLVEFCSQTLQVYTDHFLALDIMTVGEGLLNLPIKAECVVPKVTPSVALLDFEECYLRYAMQGMPVQVRCFAPLITLSTNMSSVLRVCSRMLLRKLHVGSLRAPLMCRYPYTRALTLTNDTHLPCKCEVLGQEQRSKGLATFTTATTSGLIPAKGTMDVQVTLQALRLGRIQLPLQVKVRVPLT